MYFGGLRGVLYSGAGDYNPRFSPLSLATSAGTER